MSLPVRDVNFSEDPVTRAEQLVTREWLVTAGNGSYACGSLGFVPTRRHHGLLVANQPAPQGRVLSLVQLREEFTRDDGNQEPVRLWGIEQVEGGVTVHGSGVLTRFHLDGGSPTWTYEFNGLRVQKSIVMPYQSRTVCIRYQFEGNTAGWGMTLRPVVQFRGHNDSVATVCDATCEASGDGKYTIRDDDSRHELHVQIEGTASEFAAEPQTDHECFYRVEHARGYDHVGNLHSPGSFRVELGDTKELLFTASMEPLSFDDGEATENPFDRERARREALLQRVPGTENGSTRAELILAADQFLMTPAKREVDQPDTDPSTPEPERRSVIAGYPWFTDWGRDTMISLPGLTLSTNRHAEARQILLTFADYIRDGLIPNLFPEGGQEGMYHTADATLWYFEAIADYERATGDQELVERLYPKLTEIIDSHLHGTLFGIHVDPADELLVQGQHDVQLTWMDAKAGDWVVTPRRGKAVEINALWYNALFHYCEWGERLDRLTSADGLRERLRKARENFNSRFWFADGNYLFDVVDGEDGDDSSLRPNQLFAISLTHAVLNEDRWDSVLRSCVDHLLTPVGLRSLAMTSENYIGVYYGDVYKRDAAYHQGTVWSWLIGPLVKAWCRAKPDEKEVARSWLSGLEAHLGEACIGQISEIFSGDAPHEPKGCFAQAWGVAELLTSLEVVNGSRR